MDAYIHQADLHCDTCADAIRANMETDSDPRHIDSDDYPQGPYTDGGGEADTPQHCGTCGKFLENPLTDDGKKYIADCLSRFIENLRGKGNGMNGVLQEWLDFYAYEIKIT